jgi:Undecaprenyl-phosphate galactose phosphotransferase WbaP
MALVLLPIARSGLRRIMSSFPGWGEPCVIVGAGSTGRQAAMLLASRPWLGLHPIGFLDDDAALLKTRIAGLPVLGTIGDVHRTDRDAVSATYAIIALPGVDPATRARTIDRLALTFRHLLVTPALPGVPGIAAETREFADHLALEIGQNLLSPTARITKRCIDITLVMAFILTCWWLVLLLAAWIRLSSPGPAFYSQARVGQGGRPFRAWKFRSMVADADRRLEAILAADPMLRQEWEKDRKLRNDPRITAIGRFLRRTSLDELPQLWNVLAGEMSLVGPRPIVEDEIPRYGEHFALFCKVRPGMSGLWQVSGRSDTGYEERVALDCYYVRSWSIWLDLVIIARTFRVVLLGRGAY